MRSRNSQLLNSPFPLISVMTCFKETPIHPPLLKKLSITSSTRSKTPRSFCAHRAMFTRFPPRVPSSHGPNNRCTQNHSSQSSHQNRRTVLPQHHRNVCHISGAQRLSPFSTISICWKPTSHESAHSRKIDFSITQYLVKHLKDAAHRRHLFHSPALSLFTDIV